jgi:LmbE family N-acetylglucosaminyl deacetylase
MRVLAVIAHPDDEALGCGGRLAKHADAGDDVMVLLPTRRRDPRGIQDWEALLSSLKRSCEILGARLQVSESLLDETDAEPAVHRLHDLIAPWVESADLVLTHWPGDANQVHRGVSRAVEIATRPFRRRRNVSLFEIPTSTDQIFGGAAGAFSPTEFVVLNPSQVRRKLEALDGYAGELAPGRRSEDVDRMLRVRGAAIGVDYAEAYATARLFL